MKNVKKPMYNIYSENINCTYESNENFKYCTKFLEKNHYITKDKFIDELTKYHTKNPIEEETNKTNKTKKPIFIYGVISLFIILVIIVISVIIKKRKSEL